MRSLQAVTEAATLGGVFYSRIPLAVNNARGLLINYEINGRIFNQSLRFQVFIYLLSPVGEEAAISGKIGVEKASSFN